MEPCIVIHGGSRTIPDAYQESIRQGVKLAARKGYEVLLEVNRELYFKDRVLIGLLQQTITWYKTRHAGGQAHYYSRTGTLKQRDLNQSS